MKKQSQISQFKITLLEVSPRVWRRIQVPADYTFWDLHVAIQDSMGWLDSHLHAFFFERDGKRIEIGIPVEPPDDHPFFSGVDVKLTEYFTEPGAKSRYDYDFGDDWQHEVLYEGISHREDGVKYPHCVDGRYPCPPEDCGGPGGYARLRRILRNPKHKEYLETVQWMEGMAGLSRRAPFDDRNPGAVRFDNPRTRLRMALSK
jgi:hypothetical protein